MKVLTINTRYTGGGGAAYIASTIHKEINKSIDFSSTFLYGRGSEGDDKSKRIIHNNMDYISALTFRLFSSEININKYIEEYVKNCDIVHLHNIHGYYVDYIKLFNLLKKYNKKIVWTLHDMWALTGRCCYSFGCEKWKYGCGKCPNKNIYPKSLIDKSRKELIQKSKVISEINKDNMIIVTPSRWLANICKNSYLHKFRIIDIPNGIEDNYVNMCKYELRKKYKIHKEKKVILFVAADTNDERKGIKFILDIIPKCQNYNFISIGKEIKSFEADNFIQLGYISDRNSVNEIYSMADVFIIPSLDDNFPTTVLESFSNATPVIGFNQGGILEQIDNKTGRVVNKINSEALRKNIIDILENEERLKLYSLEARKKFLKEYNLKLFIQNYIEQYKILGDKI